MTPFLNRRDLRFQLFEVLRAQDLTARERYRDHDQATFDAVLTLAADLAETHFLPHRRDTDTFEPHIVNGRVQLVPDVQKAIHAFRDAGFFSAHHDEALGGLQLPWLITQAALACFQAANIATSAYPFLTIGNANLLRAFGTPEQQEKYLRPLLEGRWFGTMALSEPHAGSGLADITTLATPRDDGTYTVAGTKMWISGGEHELSENILHLVLARTPGAPPGVKGISLFLVPRYRVTDDGRAGASNHVVLAGLNHKLGYRGTTNTLLNFGEGGDSLGELVGTLGGGLNAMFHMMNEARIGVGLGATMLGVAGYQYSLAYARERTQGRAASTRDPSSPPVPIIAHADVRRMLLAQKATVEGALALGLYAARLVDDERTADTPEERATATLLLDLLTPLAKAWPSSHVQTALDHALQILGGAGYTRDHPVEQLWRDNRLNPIHEGTNGIQGLDLLGRKVTAHGGRSLQLLAQAVTQDLAAAEGLPDVQVIRDAVRHALTTSAQALQAILTQAPDLGPDRFLANADSALEMLGGTVIGWMWLRQATVAARALPDATGPDADFYRGKLHAAQYFARFELPRVDHHARLLASADPTTYDMQDAWY
ncbi:acyl-CoA dehydrogenase [Deinococcus maricopensis]|uniref:Acyl-CoA dehydrogenase domain-containing protein n=1 Tax=Deinococcus maricopensis (strain DSM 21211 / LMG 22137 / NRRL B-23946 / LB-34) TaxID=709986 RepID=E8U727_DEIML|nr:acyl-CoA dehydrogenase [Deinococcus maricopensis]ADV66866.1 acyl-CoA dehydrogenase domain-containing protein [Deinococcus maricopensis DSM 21211]